MTRISTLRTKLDAMDPTVLARSIASIEQKYGLRIDAWQPIGRNNMGAKCNEDFGWVGLRGACKRLKKTSDRTRLIQESKQSLSAKIRRQKGFKAIGGAELARDPASSNEPFKRIDGLSSLAEWDADVEEARKYTNYSILKGKEGRFQTLEKTVSAMPDQSEWAAEIAANRKTIKSRMAGLSKGLDTSLDSAILADNASIVDMIKELRGSSGYRSGGVSKGGKLQAAFIYKLKRDHVYLEYLAANPASLLKKGGAKGSGTAAIKDLIERSIEGGLKGRIKLTALDGAVGFYEKLGFTSKGGRLFELSASAAKRILKGKS